jgi:hypothetical protein
MKGSTARKFSTFLTTSVENLSTMTSLVSVTGSISSKRLPVVTQMEIAFRKVEHSSVFHPVPHRALPKKIVESGENIR